MQEYTTLYEEPNLSPIETNCKHSKMDLALASLGQPRSV